MPPRVELEAAPVKRGEALWTWDGTIARSGLLPMGRFPVRMLVAGYPLPHGKLGLVLIAPLEPTEKVVAWLQETGDVNFVVAPNKQHWWWAPAAKAAFPGSLLVAPAELARERPELPVDVRVTAAGVQDLPGSWPADVIDVISLQGLPLLCELALLHKPSQTLILTDSAFNFDRGWRARGGPALGGPVGLYLSCVDGHRRCCMTKTFKLLIRDPAALKDSFDQIVASWEFDQVSVAHGEFISSGGKDALAAGSLAFVDNILKERAARAAAAAPGGAGPGAAVAALAAVTVIGAGVAIGVSGILAAKQR